MANETVGFQTSLFGFNKKDVLSCIDRLTAENLKAEQQAKEKLNTLQAQLDTASSENTTLKAKAEENTEMISQLVNQADEQQKKLDAVSEKNTQLETKVTTLDNQNQEFRRRLFQGEQETIRLRRENDTLRKECAEKQEQIEQQTAHLAELKTTCETRLNQIHSENDARVAEAKQEAQARIRAAEQQAGSRVAQAERQLAETRRALVEAQVMPDPIQMRQSAERVGHSLAEVKHDLSVVGDNVNRLSADLQRSMQMLEAALSQAEQDADSLHAAAAPKAAAPQPAPYRWAEPAPAKKPEAVHTPEAQAHPAQETVETPDSGKKLAEFAANVPSMAERLLDRLAKLLDQ